MPQIMSLTREQQLSERNIIISQNTAKIDERNNLIKQQQEQILQQQTKIQ